MKTKNPTPTIEDYLGIIYTLERDGEAVIGARLAELLEVSPPTVTVTLQRMVRDGWITLDDSKKVHLTTEGITASRNVIRRHMLTEWMLAKILDLPWSKIHEEAHKLEHSISREVEKSLMDKLNDPDQCPHGNPMPGNESISDNWLPLSETIVGDHLVIRRIHEFLEDDPDLMLFLEESKIVPGEEVIVAAQQISNKTITLEIQSTKVTLGLDAARHIYIERIITEEHT